MRLFIGIILFFIILASCSSEDSNNYEVGSDFLDDDVTIKVIDTFSISTSTFKLDSLITSSTGRILLGHVEEDELGGVTAQSYFQLLTTDFDIDVEATYDSIGLILNYDKYYHGDTTITQTYSVHRITETVEPEESAFYYKDYLEYDSESIGNITFKPRPNRESDSLYIPIDDNSTTNKYQLGEELFEAIQDNDISSSVGLIDVFKGLTIIPENTDGSILGFNVETTEDTDNNSYMRLYYSLDEGDNSDNSYYIDFVISDLSKQFNQITSDFTTSDYPDKLARLEDTEESLSSDETNNRTFIQGSSGISTKINIPTLQKLNELSFFGTALEAELKFKPYRNSYGSTDELKDSLLVFIINKKNEIQSQLTDIDGNTAYALLNDNVDEFDTNTFYTVDLSGYVEQILLSEFELDYSLMIQFVDYNTAFEKIAIEDNNEDLKLSIKYLNY